MDVEAYLPTEPEELKRVNEGDYQDSEGIWHCGVCKRAKQRRIELGQYKRTVWCICDCEEKKLQERRKQEEFEENQRRICNLRDTYMGGDANKNASFSDYKLRQENKKVAVLAKKYVQRFPEMEEKNQGIIFYGPVGTGKSYTAACIANALIERNVSVIMTSLVKILKVLKGLDDEVAYTNALNNCRLLIIDDLGAERSTDYALEKVYDVIDSRVRKGKPMILTTNLSFQEMMQCPDIRYKRIFDRIFEKCYPVEVPGTSMRIVQAYERQKEMKKLLE